jgi:uncharacterized protein (DUF1499 family)
MRKSLAIISTLGLLIVALWLGSGVLGGRSTAFAGIFSLAGDQPTNLGWNNGQFAACATTPNCVSSQAKDPEHSIAAIRYSGDPTTVWQNLNKIIRSQPNTTIVTANDEYLYVQYTSKLMGFVDDVEFYRADGGVIQARSASRLGESDLGVNRQRIETIREQLTAN